MSEDGDRQIPDLEIETRTWNKLQRNLKSAGFREGASQGRDAALQRGFDQGYSDGFGVGRHLGLLRGIISCQKELEIKIEDETINEKELESLSGEICTLCFEEKNSKTSPNEDTVSEHLENIIQRQKIRNEDIIKNLKSSGFDKNL